MITNAGSYGSYRAGSQFNTIYNCLNSDWKSQMFNPKVFVFWAGENKHRHRPTVNGSAKKKLQCITLLFQAEFEPCESRWILFTLFCGGCTFPSVKKIPCPKCDCEGKKTLALKASR